MDKGETKKNVQEDRKRMSMHKALHWRGDIVILYVSRKEGGSGLANNEDSVDASIRRLEYYIKKSKETNYSDQKKHQQYKDKPNNNNKETEMGRKTTVWIVQTTN